VLGAHPQISLPLVVVGFAPKPPISFGSWGKTPNWELRPSHKPPLRIPWLCHCC